MTSHDPDALVTVRLARSEFEAGVLAATLREHGIEAFTFGRAHGAIPLGTRLLSVPVQVRAKDRERAEQALAERAVDAAEVDWDEVDVGEREDRLPLHTPGRMPLVVKVGYIAAIVIVLIAIVGAIVATVF
jgi:hypothetical protein